MNEGNSKWTKNYLAILVGVCYLLCLFTIVTNLFFQTNYKLGGVISLAVFTIFFSILFVLND